MLPILHQSLWRDEAMSFFIAEKPLNEIFLIVTKDSQGPFYYFILHYWMLFFGNSEAVIRSLSVVFHISLGILVFFFVHHLTRSKIASVFTSLFILFNPFLLSYSFEARPYSLLAFLLTFALYLFFKRKFILSSILFSLAILTHNFALFSIFGLAIYWLFSNRLKLFSFERNFVQETGKTFLLPVISILFWGLFILGQWQRAVESFWINPVTSGVFIQTFEKFFGGPLFFEGQDLLLTIAFILSGFVITAWVTIQREHEEKHEIVFLLVSLTPILISYIISSLWVPNFHERYLIASVPLLIIFSAILLYKLVVHGGKNLSYVIVSLAVLYLVSSIQAAEKIVRIQTKPHINYAVEEILKKARGDDVIVPKEYLNFLETKYYVRQAGSSIPVYALSSTGEIVWYANAAVIDHSEIIKELPKDTRVWQVNPDGGYTLIE